MDFAFSTAPERIAASMTRPLAYAAMDLGHGAHALTAARMEGQWRLTMEDSSLELPADPFVYGHTGLVEAIKQGSMPGWRVDWEPERFDRELWIARLGDAMWNKDARILTLGEALDSWREGFMHLCPAGADSGPKSFKGICVERSELSFELGRAARGRPLDLSIRVALSRPDAPHAEYRCVFNGTEHAASGRYMLGGRLSEEAGAPASVIAFATEIAKTWMPSQYCVIDVGVGADGRMGIVEFNGLNASGLYAIRREPVIESIAATWGVRPTPARRLAF